MNVFTRGIVAESFISRTYATLGLGLLATAIAALTALNLHFNLVAIIIFAVLLIGSVFPIMSTRGLVSAAWFMGASVLWGLFMGPVIGHYLNHNPGVVVNAFFLTAAIFVGLTAYVFKTGRDFSAWGGALFTILFALVVVSLASLFIHSTLLNLAISAVGAVLFSFYILYDTSMIVNGKYEDDQYASAALGLYLDILNIFLDLLRLLGYASDD